MYFHGEVPKYFEGETSRSNSRDVDRIRLDFPTRVPDFPYSAGPIQSIAAGEDHCLAVIGGRLFGYGSNKFFQLHHKLNAPVGGKNGCNTFIPLPDIPGAEESAPAQVACGARHSIVRLVDGAMFACGDNSYSQLGFTGRGKSDAFSQWRRVALDEPVTKIFAAGFQSFALSGGRVFSWGRQEYGSLGHGTRGEVERQKSGGADLFHDVETPKLIQWFVYQRVSIVDLCPARTHTVAMSATDVYAWGEGAYSKLGNGSTSDEVFPRRIQFPQTKNLEKLEAIGASDDATIILKTSQLLGAIIYICGKDGGSEHEWRYPQRLILPFKIEDPREIICGPGHFYLTTHAGEVYCYGKNNSVSSVGLGKSGKDSDTGRPTDLKQVTPVAGLFIEKIVEMRAGAFWVADDTKRDADRLSLEVMVDKGDRLSAQAKRQARSFKKRGEIPPKKYDPDNFETNIIKYFQLLLGHEEGLARFGTLPKAAPETKAEDVYRRAGASSLHTGSHVRLWMTDVYALGTVTLRDISGLSKNHFEVTWLREDWEPEILEIHSDDEVLDEDNENRWQKLWFPYWEE
jgi:alpha-tubulin suppressor-like RCC1 family protein